MTKDPLNAVLLGLRVSMLRSAMTHSGGPKLGNLTHMVMFNEGVEAHGENWVGFFDACGSIFMGTIFMTNTEESFLTWLNLEGKICYVDIDPDHMCFESGAVESDSSIFDKLSIRTYTGGRLTLVTCPIPSPEPARRELFKFVEKVLPQWGWQNSHS